MNSYDIFGIGAGLLDTEVAVSEEDLQRLGIDKGVMSLVDDQGMQHVIGNLREHLYSSNRSSGGSAANSLIAASRFGCRSFFTCRVADDEDGHFFLSDLASSGLDYNSNGQLASGTTGKCLVMITPDAERTMNTCLAVSDKLAPDCLHPEIIEHAQYVYLEGYLCTSKTGAMAARQAREIGELQGSKIVASLSDPALITHFREPLAAMIGDNLELLFCNEEEALQWTGKPDLESAAAELRKTARTFAITLGASGALLFDGDNLYRVDSPRVKAVDSNGAGDMFAGTFLAALIKGENYQTAGKLACHAASEVVQNYGPRLKADHYERLSRRYWSAG